MSDEQAKGAAKNTKEMIVQTLKTVYDPEIPVNIYEMGLIYDIELDEKGNTTITMTLTSPNCPVAETLPVEVEQKVMAVPGVNHAVVHIVWEPIWNPDMMSEAAKLELGMF
ncbi:DUF59 domain-containing protein [bacterium]|nr:DUF59 domain-containing protein [bacterium]